MPDSPNGDPPKCMVAPKDEGCCHALQALTFSVDFQALQSLPDQPPVSRDKVRVHPTNNTFTFSARQSVRAQAYLRIMSLQIGVWTIEFQVYAPPPNDAFCGIMFNAYNGFTNAEVLKDSRKSNPTMHVVVGGRRIRRTNYVVVTLHADCFPRCIFYHGIYVHLYPFYPRGGSSN
ncbi:hypothetical protein HPB51_028752 [Rhipicephalus microplus]|uniref:Uncharacterized protein n=1 Tax=Rhipicephalus microplus TaxID=6941 RepID=A0A9J6CWZ9_RHIMP|nr:hypothetical protein HPB51_028752 [Rhipicephalus microplus]